MANPPRRSPVPTITSPTFDEEPATSVTTTDAATPDVATSLDPEPLTIPVISITAPSFAEAAKTGPFAPKQREGDARTVAARVSNQAPRPASAQEEPPDPETRTEIAGLVLQQQEHPPELTPPATPVPQAQKWSDEDLEEKSTVLADPWEFQGEKPAQAAELASDYDSGGVELDTAGRLVAPGAKPVRPRKREESDPGVAPADLLSVALEVWPDAPPSRPASPLLRPEPVAASPPRAVAVPPRVEPVVAPPPRPAGPPPRVEPVVAAPRPASLPPRVEPAAPPPHEPDTTPRQPIRLPTPRTPALKPSALAHADTVLRAPRSDMAVEEDWFTGSTRLPHLHGSGLDEQAADERHDDERHDDERHDDERHDDEHHGDERHDDEHHGDEHYDDEPYDEEASAPSEVHEPETRIRGSRARSARVSEEFEDVESLELPGRSGWSSALWTFLLLGLTVAGVWFWFTRG